MIRLSERKVGESKLFCIKIKAVNFKEFHKNIKNTLQMRNCMDAKGEKRIECGVQSKSIEVHYIAFECCGSMAITVSENLKDAEGQISARKR